MNVTVKLTEKELTESLEFLLKWGNSLLLPDNFEYKALDHTWDKIVPELAKIDLLSYNSKSVLDIIVPKHQYGFRPVELLDPIDNIFYTALALKIGPTVEEFRNKKLPDRTFSGIFQIVPDMGKIIKNNWEAMTEKKLELGKSYSYVTKTDIVDFFPRIYQHRLNNAVTAVCGDKYIGRIIEERLLRNWTRGTSYGIPTGPRASLLYAECLLFEVDQFLLSEDIEFCRFVDDYYLFGKSLDECKTHLLHLSERLHRSQGLSINSSKTKIFGTNWLFDEDIPPEKKEEREKKKLVRNWLKQINPYEDEEATLDDLPIEAQMEIEEYNAANRLKTELEKPFLDIREIRYNLNILFKIRGSEALDLVIENLSKLGPVAKDVKKFIFSVKDEISKDKKKAIGHILLEKVMERPLLSDYMAIWILQLFLEDIEWNNIHILRRIARTHQNALVRRQAILAIGESGDRSAILDNKDRYQTAVEWEARSILFSCRNLPYDERNALYRHLSVPKDNLLTNAIIKYSKTFN